MDQIRIRVLEVEVRSSEVVILKFDVFSTLLLLEFLKILIEIVDV